MAPRAPRPPAPGSSAPGPEARPAARGPRGGLAALPRGLWRSGPCLAGILVLLCTPAGAPRAQQPTSAPVPVFFAPLKLSKAFAKHETVLRAKLVAELVSSRRYVESASTEVSADIGSCARQVNSDANSQSCWIRLGQGMGATHLASGSVGGTEKRCTISLRLTELETRVSNKHFVETLSPCTLEGLMDKLVEGGRTLAGVPTGAGAQEFSELDRLQQTFREQGDAEGELKIIEARLRLLPAGSEAWTALRQRQTDLRMGHVRAELEAKLAAQEQELTRLREVVARSTGNCALRLLNRGSKVFLEWAVVLERTADGKFKQRDYSWTKDNDGWFIEPGGTFDLGQGSVVVLEVEKPGESARQVHWWFTRTPGDCGEMVIDTRW